jgi:hypothetical protein
MDLKDYEEMRRQLLEEFEKDKKQEEEIEMKEPKICVSPNAMAPDAATVLYIIAMAVAALFHGRILIWIVLTIVWRMHMSKFGK